MRKIAKATQAPKEVYAYWHDVWADYLGRNHREALFAAGLGGLTFSELAPDIPDGKGYTTYRFNRDCSVVEFVDTPEADAICEYASYDLGFEVVSNPGAVAEEYFADGRIRLVKGMEHFEKMFGVIDILRRAQRYAIEAAERKFDVELPKYW